MTNNQPLMIDHSTPSPALMPLLASQMMFANKTLTSNVFREIQGNSGCARLSRHRINPPQTDSSPFHPQNQRPRIPRPADASPLPHDPAPPLTIDNIYCPSENRCLSGAGALTGGLETSHYPRLSCAMASPPTMSFGCEPASRARLWRIAPTLPRVRRRRIHMFLRPTRPHSNRPLAPPPRRNQSPKSESPAQPPTRTPAPLRRPPAVCDLSAFRLSAFGVRPGHARL